MGLVLSSSENHIGLVGSVLTNVVVVFTRPADSTQYAVGDLVSNSTTAALVQPLTFPVLRVSGGSCFIRRARLRKSATTLTSASFRLHLYGMPPGGSGADNAAWSTAESLYYGDIDITCTRAFTDAAHGIGVPNTGSEINIAGTTTMNVYGLLEATATYTPSSGESFLITLETYQN